MAWTPNVNVFDGRSIKNNLIDYFKANQSDALKWANNNSSLPIVKAFYQEARVVKVFPSCSLIQMGHRSIYKGDLINIDFFILLEVAIVHGKQAHLSEISPKYSMAFESMLANVPKTTFSENSKINIDEFGIEEPETNFDVQEKLTNSFIQVFQTRARWLMSAVATTN